MVEVQASRTAKVSATSREVTDLAHSGWNAGPSPSKSDKPSSPFSHRSFAKQARFLPSREIVTNHLPETITASGAMQERREGVPFGRVRTIKFCRSPKASTGDLTAAAGENDLQNSEIAEPAFRERCSTSGTKSSESGLPSHPIPNDSSASDQLTEVA